MSEPANAMSGKMRGFTLTEIAIVLGVVGLILGAIWTAATMVYQNKRTQTAVENTQAILQGYRSLFTGHAVDTGDWYDMTCIGINSNFFPTTMLPAVACTTGNTATYPIHPWNNYMQVWSHQTWQGIIIGFFNLPQDACNQLANQLFGAADVLWESINGTAVTLPPIANGVPFTPSQIQTDCSQVAGTNTVEIMFKAR